MTTPPDPPATRTLNPHGRRIAAELTEIRRLAGGDPIGPHMVRRTTAHEAIEKIAGILEGVVLYDLPMWEAPAAPAMAPATETYGLPSLDQALLNNLLHHLHVAVIGQAGAGWADVSEGEDPESHVVSKAVAMEGAGDAIAHEIEALFTGEGPARAIARRLAFYRRRIEELEAKVAAEAPAPDTKT